MGTREDILAAKDLGEKTEEVPEWDKTVIMTGMTGTSRGDVVAALVGKDEDEVGVYLLKQAPALVAKYALDAETRTRIFTDEDIPALGEKNGEVTQRLAGIVLELSGLKKDAIEKAQA